jgi:hypothetical protein
MVCPVVRVPVQAGAEELVEVLEVEVFEIVVTTH